MRDASVVIPELTAEHQKQVLLIQRQILTLQVNINNAQKQLEQLGPIMNNVLTKIAQDLKIDPNAFTFDLDNLKLVAKSPAPTTEDQIGRAS